MNWLLIKEDNLLSKYREIIASLEKEMKLNADHFTVKRLIYEYWLKYTKVLYVSIILELLNRNIIYRN